MTAFSVRSSRADDCTNHISYKTIIGKTINNALRSIATFERESMLMAA
ncbi:MAG: hypothetical protein M0R51_06035 [Clostridia bacterium]|nr:hypothetical protein [Clostridia bacterium]